MLNMNQLRTFYEVALATSIQGASKELHVSPAAISMMIKAFESDCSLHLFKRTSRKIALTESGHILLQACRPLFQVEKNIESLIDDLRGLKKGILKIGTSKAYTRYMSVHYVQPYHLRYPGIKIILDEGSSSELAQSILKLRNELAIIAEVEEFKGIELIPFRKEKAVLFASSSHPFSKRRKGIHFHELEKQPLVMREKGTGTRKLIEESFARHHIVPNTYLETSNTDSIVDLVSSGEAVSFGSWNALHEDLKNRKIRIIPIIDEDLHLNLKIAFLKDQPLSLAAKTFLQTLQEIEKREHVNRME